MLGPNGGGLYQVRFRVDDPISGRWLSRDPAGFVDGANLYQYCSGMASCLLDPSGLSSCEPPSEGSNPIEELASEIERKGKLTSGNGTGWSETLNDSDRAVLRKIANNQDQMVVDMGKALAHGAINGATLVTGPIATAVLLSIDSYIQSGSIRQAIVAGGIVATVAAILHMAPRAGKLSSEKIARAFAQLVAKAEAVLGRKLSSEEIKLFAEQKLIVMESEAAAKQAALTAAGISDAEAAQLAREVPYRAGSRPARDIRELVPRFPKKARR